MQQERIFLSGGAGFIGSRVAMRLYEQGHAVMIYDSFSCFVPPLQMNYAALVERQRRLPKGDPAFEQVRGDLRHRGLLQRTVNAFQPTRVIHLAALPIAGLSDRFPEAIFEQNLLGTMNLIDVASEISGMRRFVNVSSSMVYGDFEYAPADEDHPKAPKDLYGGTKLAAETLVQAYGRRFEVPYTIIRPSAVYGPTDVNRRVTQIFVENALRGEALTLENGGESKLDFTHVDDTADGLVRAVFSDQACNRVYNITRGRGRSIRELAELIASHVPGTKIVEREATSFRPERGALSIERAREELGYEPKTNIEDGIPPYIEFVRRTLEQPAPDESATRPRVA